MRRRFYGTTAISFIDLLRIPKCRAAGIPRKIQVGREIKEAGKNFRKKFQKPLDNRGKLWYNNKVLLTSYHILKTVGEFLFISPTEEGSLYIIQVRPFLSYRERLFFFLNG